MDDEEAEALLTSELQEFRNNLNNLLQFGEAKKKDDEEATARAMAALQEVMNNPVLQLMGEIQVSVIYSHLMTRVTLWARHCEYFDIWIALFRHNLFRD